MLGEILEDINPVFQIDVKRNNEITLAEIKSLNYQRIIISPGPGHPADPSYFGVSSEILKNLGKEISILGICLGMQGMATVFGGEVVRAGQPMHGKISTINHDGKGIFTSLPANIDVMRYHSLIAKESTLPKDLVVTAKVVSGSGAGEIMGLRHKSLKIEGVQFHPESFASEEGYQMLKNFLVMGL